MSIEREDEGTIAMAVAYFIASTADASSGREPWQVEGLDIGEVEIACANGQRFRLTVEEIEEDDEP